jgi:hypothetical protein
MDEVDFMEVLLEEKLVQEGPTQGQQIEVISHV